MTLREVICAALAIGAISLTACDRRESALAGLDNATITFHGKALDQDGNPLSGVRVAYQSEAVTDNGSWSRRGEPAVFGKVSAVSGPDGRFSFTVTAHVLRRLEVVGPAGYRHFVEQHIGTLANRTVPSTYGYRISSWGYNCFKSDADNPAVFVFVRDGVREVSALPCKGGYSSPNGIHWFRNTAAWPVEPSLKGVVQKQAATSPSTEP